MKLRLVIFLIVVGLVLVGGEGVARGAGGAVGGGWRGKVEAGVWEATLDGRGEFLIYMAAQADLEDTVWLETKEEKGAYVYQRLTQVAEEAQLPVIEVLKKSGAQYRSFWIANMIWVKGDVGLLATLAQRPDVSGVYANPRLAFDAPVAELDLSGGQGAQVPQAIEGNLLKVNADEVWAQGYSGQGAVIGGQDTGYQWDHPALKEKYRGWTGDSADHNYSWHDAIHEDDAKTPAGNPCGFDTSEPCDDDGHGTHTMGIMVGDDEAGNQIGMAPAAEWIGCRNMEEGYGTPATYMECYQWFVAPTDLAGNNPRPDLAPDVINNSWGCPPIEGCTEPEVLQQVVENVRAAGIMTVHSAGNQGQFCGSVNTPAAIYEASFTVGNVTFGDEIAPTSSIGPVMVDGSGRLKPDITAPGTFIRSSIPGGAYGYKSGTSMAGPHVAGLAALLISAKPELSGDVDKIERLIRQSAVPLITNLDCGGTAGVRPNNVYGWGRIDALGAMVRLFQDIEVYLPIVY